MNTLCEQNKELF